MRVLVTGGRSYGNQWRVDQVLDMIHNGDAGPIVCLIQGEATGADSLAKDWATRNGVPTEDYPADWSNLEHPGPRRIRRNRKGQWYDANAGYRRNTEMLERGRPDLGVVFPGGPGTADMHARILRAGIATLEAEDIVMDGVSTDG